jgi:hypothetical protein
MNGRVALRRFHSLPQEDAMKLIWTALLVSLISAALPVRAQSAPPSERAETER